MRFYRVRHKIYLGSFSSFLRNDLVYEREVCTYRSTTPHASVYLYRLDYLKILLILDLLHVLIGYYSLECFQLCVPFMFYFYFT